MLKVSNKISYKISKERILSSYSLNKDQMSLVPGLVDKRFAVREEHLNFLHYKSRWSEKSLNETLLGEISMLKLDINDYRE